MSVALFRVSFEERKSVVVGPRFLEPDAGETDLLGYGYAPRN